MVPLVNAIVAARVSRASHSPRPAVKRRKSLPRSRRQVRFVDGMAIPRPVSWDGRGAALGRGDGRICGKLVRSAAALGRWRAEGGVAWCVVGSGSRDRLGAYVSGCFLSVCLARYKHFCYMPDGLILCLLSPRGLRSAQL